MAKAMFRIALLSALATGSDCRSSKKNNIQFSEPPEHIKKAMATFMRGPHHAPPNISAWSPVQTVITKITLTHALARCWVAVNALHNV